MGQGVAVTRLQMAMAIGAIANGGVLMRPMLVKQLEDDDGNVIQRYEPQSVRRVVSEVTAAEMTKALKTVVSKGRHGGVRGDHELCRRWQDRHGAKGRGRKIFQRPVRRLVHRVFPGGQS